MKCQLTSLSWTGYTLQFAPLRMIVTLCLREPSRWLTSTKCAGILLSVAYVKSRLWLLKVTNILEMFKTQSSWRAWLTMKRASIATSLTRLLIRNAKMFGLLLRRVLVAIWPSWETKNGLATQVLTALTRIVTWKFILAWAWKTLTSILWTENEIMSQIKFKQN